MRLLVIGANGKIGQRVLRRCVERRMAVSAMIRNPEHAESMRELGVEPVLGDLEGNLSDVFGGVDQVLFTAGSGNQTGGDKTLLVDLWGSIRCIEEAEKRGVQSFIMLSSLKANDPLRGPEKIRHYLVARHMADDRMLRSPMHHVVLRPCRLKDTEATGRVTGEYDPADENNARTLISRDDVAACVMEVLERPIRSGSIVDLVEGDTRIQDYFARYRSN